MNTATTAILITLSSLSLITSCVTLTVILVGSKQMYSEIEEVKTKTNMAINSIKTALDNLEI